MVKIKFYEPCKDRYTDEIYECDVIYMFDKKRAQEILKTGKAYEVKEVEFEEETAEETAEEPQSLDERLESGEMIQLSTLSKAELIELAKSMDVPIRGNKEDIIERILEQQGA